MDRIDRILRDESDTAWSVQHVFSGRSGVLDKHCAVGLDAAKQTSMEESARQWPQAKEQFELLARLERLELQQPQLDPATRHAMGPR